MAGMLARKPRMLVTVAFANKMARIVWARWRTAAATELRPRRNRQGLRRQGRKVSREEWRNGQKTGSEKPVK